MALAVSWSGGGCCDSHRVTSTYRYKRPPRKRKAVALEVPAVVTVAREKLGRVARARQPVTVAADPEAAPRLAIVTTASRKQAKQDRAARRLEDRPQDSEAGDAIRAWLEKAKWGRGPPG